MSRSTVHAYVYGEAESRWARNGVCLRHVSVVLSYLTI
jgi:hypothetical protein